MPTKGRFTDADVATPTQATPPTKIDSPGQMLSASAKMIGQGAVDLGKGALKGAGSTMRGIGNLESKIPGLKSLFPGDVQEYLGPEGEKINTAHGNMQSLGKGAEQIGEYFIPGGAEEKLASKLPMLGKLAKPISRMAGSELVNQAQGGPTGAGAVGAGIGEGISSGMRSLAPHVAETAMRIPSAERAFSKTPGTAILESTRGIIPSTVGKSAQEETERLTRVYEQMARDASQRPTPRIAGFLQPPVQEIPLAPAPAPRNPRMRPMTFDAQVNPEEPLEPRSGNRMAPISEYPIANPHYLSGSEHPELSGRVTPLQNPEQVTTRMGTLLRRPEMSASIPPALEANPSVSLRGARSAISGPMQTAAAQNTPKVFGQLQPMQDTLSRRFTTGEAIPENITPSDALNLKRGFSKEHLETWNPDVHKSATNAGRQAYHAIDSEMDRALPGGAETNQRISSLIPVLRAADKAERAPSLFQRTAGRVGAHTGALTMGGMGAMGGYHAGGLPGAIAGGAMGILGPELLASPESQMILARTMGNKALQNAAMPASAAATSKLIQYLRSGKDEE